MFTSKHHPNGGASQHFDNERITELIRRYQTQGDPEALAGIISSAKQRILTLARFYSTNYHVPTGELISDVNWKLMRSISRYDPSRGSAFSYISSVALSVFRTAVTKRRVTTNRQVELDEVSIDKLHVNSEIQAREGLDDLTHKVLSSVRTTLTDPLERDAQRWFTMSFLADGYESRRHEAANIAMGVYRLTRTRSRELFDLTMLETRRVLFDDLKRREPIAPGRLFGTRLAWMARYAPLMNSDEFTKFVALMRNLAPYLLLIIDPENGKSHRRDRNPAICRRNIELIIHGVPGAVPLFEPEYF